MKFPSNSDLTSIGEGDMIRGQSIDTCYGKRGKRKPLVSAVATFHSHASPTMTTCRLEVLPPIIFHIPWFSTDMGELIFGSTSYYAQIADRRCDLSLPSMICSRPLTEDGDGFGVRPAATARISGSGPLSAVFCRVFKNVQYCISVLHSTCL